MKNSLPKAISYEAFEHLIDRLLLEGKTTGEDQSEFMVSLTKLNRQRMKLIDNTLSSLLLLSKLPKANYGW